MADARITIDGRIATEPRYNNVNGRDVANVRVLAGRSKRNDNDEWEKLSETAYNVAFWNEHAHLVDGLNPQKGDSVIIHGTITGLEAYEGQNGQSLSAKVSGDGIRVFPKKPHSSGFSQQTTQQNQQQGQEHQPSGDWGGDAQQTSWNGQESTDKPPFN